MYEIEDLFDNVDSHTTNKSKGITGNKVGINLIIIICNKMGFIELIFFAMMTDGKKIRCLLYKFCSEFRIRMLLKIDELQKVRWEM